MENGTISFLRNLCIVFIYLCVPWRIPDVGIFWICAFWCAGSWINKHNNKISKISAWNFVWELRPRYIPKSPHDSIITLQVTVWKIFWAKQKPLIIWLMSECSDVGIYEWIQHYMQKHDSLGKHLQTISVGTCNLAATGSQQLALGLGQNHQHFLGFSSSCYIYAHNRKAFVFWVFCFRAVYM